MTVLTSEFVPYTRRAGTLYDVLELILDRGIVIDAFVRISLVGIEIIKIDARVVVASVDTYLRFADACNRLDLEHDQTSRTVPELFGGMSGSAATAVGKKGAKKALSGVGDKAKDLKDAVTGRDEREKEPAARRRGASGEERGGSRSRRRAESEEG
jgi:hypothetical protein